MKIVFAFPATEGSQAHITAVIQAERLELHPLSLHNPHLRILLTLFSKGPLNLAVSGGLPFGRLLSLSRIFSIKSLGKFSLSEI
ncbi:5981_t:CDS:2 [Funneliformis mosseae]|uniref:5981_t:CDS:1 n=1 Tax=Funneliformis mosseae TaxID=27381 RepID=A0A9N9CGY7_FUNMO|nr:5981_t:CDS:2 [Funneliformis mosseae]